MTPTIDELKAAAERLRKHEAIRGMDYTASPYFASTNRVGIDSDAVTRDACLMKNFAVSLLSDDPVTAEWLRDVWGFVPSPLGATVIESPCRSVVCFMEPPFLVRIAGRDFKKKDGLAQSQFTMLALGLRMTPKPSI